MASQINPTNIDITYPIAGQDNDTQGFRDNFRNIKNNLTTAATEISAVQSTLSTITTDPTIIVPSVPRSSSDQGVKGQMFFNNEGFYYCYATDSWRKVDGFGFDTAHITIKYGNSNVAAYLSSGNDATITSLYSQINDFEQYANVHFATSGGPSTTFLADAIVANIAGVNSNITAYSTYANAAIAAINSNLGNVTASTINTINANINAYKTWANANLAVQASSITTVNANINAYKTWANANFGVSSFGTGDLTNYLNTGANIGNLTVKTSMVPGSNAAINIGSSTAWFGTIYGKATQAQYADLAENYVADEAYVAGTVVVFGGKEEITVSGISHDTRVAGVISTDPAYLMNSAASGLPVALTGRAPCLVQGPVAKGDRLVNVAVGVAGRLDETKYKPGCIIGKSLADIATDTIQLVEIAVGRY
jgi:hypothetical protein